MSKNRKNMFSIRSDELYSLIHYRYLLDDFFQSPRQLRAAAATEMLNIIEKKTYASPSGRNVTIDVSSMRTTVHQTVPNKSSSSSSKYTATHVEVTNESTLTCAMRLVRSGKFKNVCALNFASAKNPGGGFRGGSQAQEESIARSSTIISSLESDEATKHFYRFHKKNPRNGLYSHRAIHTQNVVVFRDNQMNLLEKPFNVSFVTCAAVNMGHYMTFESSTKDEGEKEMRNRMLTVLRCMKAHGHDALVLGAFGCGVFRNDPIFVASVWNNLLRSEEFNTCFQHVSFGIISGAPSRPSHKNDKKKKKKNDKKKKAVVDPLDCFRKEFDT